VNFAKKKCYRNSEKTEISPNRIRISELIQGVHWVKDDFSRSSEPKHYLRHDWQGTVKRSGGYHLEEWQKANEEHTKVLQLILLLIPSDAKVVSEVGVNDASLGQTSDFLMRKEL